MRNLIVFVSLLLATVFVYGIGQGCTPKKSDSSSAIQPSGVPGPTGENCTGPFDVNLEVSYIPEALSPTHPRRTINLTTNYVAYVYYSFSIYLGRYMNWPTSAGSAVDACGNPAQENPGVIKMKVASSNRAIKDCYVKNSIDDANWVRCPTSVVQALNEGQTFRVNTDDVRAVDVAGDAYGACVYNGTSSTRMVLGQTGTQSFRFLDACGLEVNRSFQFTWTVSFGPPI